VVIKDIFLKLSFLQKIEIYILVVIFFGVIYFNIPIDIVKNIEKPTLNNSKYIEQLKQLKTKIVKKENLVVTKLLIDKSSHYDILILSSKNSKNQIELNIEGKFFDIFNFLNFIKNHFIINNLSLQKEKSYIVCIIKLNTKYLYNQNIQTSTLDNIPNPFINYKTKIKNKVEKIKQDGTLKLFAIIDKNILINNSWCKLNDIVGNYKIIEISLNEVKLLNQETKEKRSLKVNHEKE